jgi:hypothetical protein
MALQGSAFLALWNDVDPIRDVEYNCWHTFEHVPERVGIEGFLAARRYIAQDRSVDRYFTLYELVALGALAGPAYTDVVDHPTDWSRSMRPLLRNFQRSPCTTLLTLGHGVAGSIATFRIGVQAVLSPDSLMVVRSALEAYLATSGVASMHLGLVETDTRFPLKNAADAEPDVGGDTYVLVIEGVDRLQLDATMPRIVETIEQCFTPGQPVIWKSFDLAFAIGRADLSNPTTRRQPARTDLRRRWQTSQEGY